MKLFGWLLGLAITVSVQIAAASDAALPKDVSLSQTLELQAALTQPIPGAQVTSGFGWRRHPLLKRSRFHAGVDYAAPVGTEVFAAGEGVVEKIERTRDRGLYLVIRHNDRLVTGYSHLSAVAEGLAEGQHVSAQELIAKVGKSGRTSGPHLDFEVFVDDMRVDPETALSKPAPAGNHADGKRVAFTDL